MVKEASCLRVGVSANVTAHMQLCTKEEELGVGVSANVAAHMQLCRKEEELGNPSSNQRPQTISLNPSNLNHALFKQARVCLTCSPYPFLVPHNMQASPFLHLHKRVQFPRSFLFWVLSSSNRPLLLTLLFLLLTCTPLSLTIPLHAGCT